MTANELLESLGVARPEFELECRKATEAAPFCGGEITFTSNLANEIASHLWWKSSLTRVEKLELTLDFYEQMPCCAFPSWISMSFNDLPPEERGFVWRQYRRCLETSEALAGPVAYSLWCDFFEREERAPIAWSALAAAPDHERRLRWLLDVSGPVPFAWKERLYRRLLPEDRWHPMIFRSTLASQYDLFGQLNVARVGRIVRRLRLPPDTPGLDQWQANPADTENTA